MNNTEFTAKVDNLQFVLTWEYRFWKIIRICKILQTLCIYISVYRGIWWSNDNLFEGTLPNIALQISSLVSMYPSIFPHQIKSTLPLWQGLFLIYSRHYLVLGEDKHAFECLMNQTPPIPFSMKKHTSTWAQQHKYAAAVGPEGLCLLAADTVTSCWHLQEQI